MPLTRIRLSPSRLTIFGLGLTDRWILHMRDGFYFTSYVSSTFAYQNQFICGPSALLICWQKCIWTRIPQSMNATTRVSDFVSHRRCPRFSRLYRWQIFSQMHRTCSCNDARAVHARHVCVLYRILATFADFARHGVNCLTKGTEWRWDKCIRTNQCRIEFMQTAHFARETGKGFIRFYT